MPRDRGLHHQPAEAPLIETETVSRSSRPPLPLHAQFGRGYGQRAAFKRAFRKALKDALAVYPEAADGGVEETDSGLLLRQVRPPILERVA